MDEVVAEREDPWPRRADFIARNFHPHLRAGIDPTMASSSTARCSTIGRSRRRSRQFRADRRIARSTGGWSTSIRIRRPRRAASRNVPGFFSTLRGAFSDIPRTQPVTDDLGWVLDFNDQVRRLIRSSRARGRRSAGWWREVITDATRSADLGAGICAAGASRSMPRSPHEAGFAYDGYVRLKLTTVRAFVPS